MENDLWLQKLHKEIGEFSQQLKVTLDKSSVYNVLAERMYFVDRCKPTEFQLFGLFTEVIQIPHIIFETRSQFLYKFCPIL